MPKKHAFIDKRRAQAYSLVYAGGEAAADQDGEAEQGPAERVLVPADELPAPPRSGEAYDDGLPPGFGTGGLPFWLHEQQLAASDPANLEPARRKELLELGFPDDGYDYLKHLRDPAVTQVSGLVGNVSRQGAAASAAAASAAEPGAGAAAAAAAAAPTVSLAAAKKPEAAPDVRLIDARGYEVVAGAEGEEIEVGEISAGTKQVKDFNAKGRAEVAENEALMARYEAHGEAEGFVEEGDMEDDFVLMLTAGDGNEAGDFCEAAGLVPLERRPARAAGGFPFGWAAGGGDADDDDAAGAGPAARDGANYHGRLLDEQFQNLAVEYDEDECGELDFNAEETRGGRDISEFAGILDDFLESSKGVIYEGKLGEAKAREEGRAAAGAGAAEAEAPAEAGPAETDLAGKTLVELVPAKSKEPLEEEVFTDQLKDNILASLDHEDSVTTVLQRTVLKGRGDEWDCESILSLNSNLSNHYSSIDTPSRKPKKLGAVPEDREPLTTGAIRLSAKSGIAVDYLDKPARPANAKRDAREQLKALVDEAPNVRPAGESKADKKARKAAVKAAQRQARALKKQVKTMFKEGEKKQRSLGGPGPSIVPM